MIPFNGRKDTRPIWLQILRIDWIGAILCVGWVTCFGISLSWAGITKSWSDRGVITVDLSCRTGLYKMLTTNHPIDAGSYACAVLDVHRLVSLAGRRGNVTDSAFPAETPLVSPDDREKHALTDSVDL